ncbi:MAG: hypothetical protein V4569_08225 [Pseudomonadota bacterium]
MSALITRSRLARLASYVSAQMVVQLVGFVAGIVLVRQMEQTQYGYYALAISMVGVANVLLDLGLGTAVLAIGGRSTGASNRLAGLVGDAFSFQRQLAVGGTVVLLPVFAAMFAGQGMTTANVIALSLLAITCSVFNARNQVALSVVRLQGNLALQQRLEIAVNVGKLLLVLAAALVYIDSRVAVAVNLVAAVVMCVLLHNYLTSHIGASGQAAHEHDGPLRSFVRQQAPNSLYYCASGQIAIWLVGLQGHTDRVAEVGALGRLALVFTLIGAVVAALVQPYFARATARRELIGGFLALNGFFGLLTALLTGFAAVLPGVMLWILGPRYDTLTRELIWMVLSASLAAWSGAVYSVGAARGWVVPSYLVLTLGIGTLATAVWLIDVSTVIGSFMMNTASAAVATLLVMVFVGGKLRRLTRTGSEGGKP